MLDSALLTTVIFLPLAGTLILLFVPKAAEETVRRVALGTALIEFAASVPLVTGFETGRSAYQFELVRQWIVSPPINYHIGIDGISLFLILLVTFLTPLAMLASWRSINTRVKEFFSMMLVLETGMVGVFASLDLFLFYVFWEVMLIPMYFIIGVWGHERRIYAAVKFVLYTMGGSVLMLVAIIWLYNFTGTFDLPQIQLLLRSGLKELAPRAEWLLFLAFFVAFAIKVPLFPFHTWLPDAHVEAPTAGSVILAGVLLKMGTYGMLRFCLPLFPQASKELAPAISVVAIIGIVYGALVAMVQPDIKKLVAFSSVSHLGFVVLGIFAFNAPGIEGAIYQMLNHGVSTGALFLMVGMLYDRRHTHLIADYGGLATPMPIFSSFFLFVCLSSLGLPLLNGFVGEFLILVGVFGVSTHRAVAAALGVVLSAVYLLWMYQRTVFGGITNEKNRTVPDLNWREKAILIPIAVMILWMGVASPMFTTRMEASTQQLIEQMQAGAGYRLAQK